jgi:hypothetical protein
VKPTRDEIQRAKTMIKVREVAERWIEAERIAAQELAEERLSGTNIQPLIQQQIAEDDARAELERACEEVRAGCRKDGHVRCSREPAHPSMKRVAPHLNKSVTTLKRAWREARRYADEEWPPSSDVV